MGRSVAFESPLERDFYILLDFDEAVASIEEQPLQIKYARLDGTPGTYTPDALVHFTPQANRRPELYEIKTRQDLRKDWSELRPRFAAAIALCREREWTFRIRTERGIRTQFLSNAKFLRRWRAHPVNELEAQRIINVARSCPEMTINSLFAGLAPWPGGQGALAGMVWHLIANRRLNADLSLPLGPDSRIRAIEPPVTLQRNEREAAI
ncbi:TnsA endonuclease N-terminal domain-containing protein [Algiphilus sp.]|uniref:TnsA endonuclease N-terminal domain-containing protein n=1 Tax=Algiphilus sp. TaxID=1872431 RepID=UPI0032EF420E